MMDRCETSTGCRTTIPLSFLKVSHLNTIPCDFYESPNEQNRMCELCTFSQIRSHIYMNKYSDVVSSFTINAHNSYNDFMVMQ